MVYKLNNNIYHIELIYLFYLCSIQLNSFNVTINYFNHNAFYLKQSFKITEMYLDLELLNIM